MFVFVVAGSEIHDVLLALESDIALPLGFLPVLDGVLEVEKLFLSFIVLNLHICHQLIEHTLRLPLELGLLLEFLFALREDLLAF